MWWTARTGLPLRAKAGLVLFRQALQDESCPHLRAESTLDRPSSTPRAPESAAERVPQSVPQSAPRLVANRAPLRRL